MGLESVNFLFRTDRDLRNELSSIKNVFKDGNRYIFKEKERFWIDILLKDDHNLSFRVALSNPLKEVTSAFIFFIKTIFKDNDTLYSYEFKITIEQINEISEKVIELIIENRKNIFIKTYGDINIAIGSDEFYKYIDNSKNKK